MEDILVENYLHLKEAKLSADEALGVTFGDCRVCFAATSQNMLEPNTTVAVFKLHKIWITI